MNKITIILVIITVIGCNSKKENRIQETGAPFIQKKEITVVRTICDSLSKYSDSTFSLKLYERAYDINMECAKKYYTITHKKTGSTSQDYIKCDVINSIDYSKYSDRKMDSLYNVLLKVENDNCILELIDTLVYLDKYKKIHLINRLSNRFDGYVSEYYETIKKNH